MDILPTLLRYVGVEPPSGLAGSELLAPPRHPPDERVVFMQYGNTPYAARTRKWKLIENLTTTQEISYELYDLAADPREPADVHARFPEVVTHLRELIGRWKTAAGSRALGNRKMKLDPELLERLRELGYVDE